MYANVYRAFYVIVNNAVHIAMQVQLAKIQGAAEQEKARSEVNAIQQQHAVEAARAEGLADAERCVSFLQHIERCDEGSDDGTQKSSARRSWLRIFGMRCGSTNQCSPWRKATPMSTSPQPTPISPSRQRAVRALLVI